MKGASNSEQAVTTKSTERQKNSLPKEQVENTDLHKPVLNKIMTTQEQCVKYNFVAPLMSKTVKLLGSNKSKIIKYKNDKIVPH